MIDSPSEQIQLVSDGGPLSRTGLSGESVWLFLWLCVAGLFTFWRVLPLPYAFDDLNQLSALAWMRSGQISWLSFLALPHNEHILPLVRVLFAGATHVGGLNAWPARAAVLLVHVTAAFGCAQLARSIAHDWRAGWLAGTIYVGAAGFSGSVVWVITGSQFSIASALLILALTVLTRQPTGRLRVLAAAMFLMVGSCLGMAGSVAAATMIPVYLSFVRQGRERRKSVAISVAVQALLLLSSVLLMARVHALPASAIQIAGALKGIWLVLTAPFLFARAWVPFLSRIVPFTPLQLALGGLVCWIALLLSTRWLETPAKLLLISIWAGDVVFMILIGLARSNDSLLELALTDRYYYFALLPLALHVGILIARAASNIPTRIPRRPIAEVGIAFVFMIAVLSVSRLHMQAAIPWTAFRYDSIAFSKGGALVKLIAARSLTTTPQPMRLVDARIPFDGVHEGKIALATLFFAEHPDGIPGVNWVSKDHQITTADGIVENHLFDGWSEAIGSPSPVCVIDGSIGNPLTSSLVDFGSGAFDDAVIQGFQPWEHGFRWMTHSGTIRLSGRGSILQIVAYCPVNLLRKKWPDLKRVQAEVSVGETPVGVIVFATPDKQDFRLTLPSGLLAQRVANKPLDIHLSTFTTWTGRDVGVLDERELSFAIISIGLVGSDAPMAALRCSAR